MAAVKKALCLDDDEKVRMIISLISVAIGAISAVIFSWAKQPKNIWD
jgi:hypothetical protein